MFQLISLFRAIGLVLLLSHSISLYAINIALTNDDGWDAMGVQILREVLIERGHKVTLVGSTSDQSGSSAALNLGRDNLVIIKQYADESLQRNDTFSVGLKSGQGAEPATAGLMAISIGDQRGSPVDLLISGINYGVNLGAMSSTSGTIGAVIQSISLFPGRGIPGIAISTELPISRKQCPTSLQAKCQLENENHYRKVANWLCSFIAMLTSVNFGDFPIGFNINYPTFVVKGFEDGLAVRVKLDKVKGVTFNRQGRLPSYEGKALAIKIGCYQDCLAAKPGIPMSGGITGTNFIKNIPEKLNSDTKSFNAGYITIVPIDGDLSIDASDQLRKLLLSRRSM